MGSLRPGSGPGQRGRGGRPAGGEPGRSGPLVRLLALLLLVGLSAVALGKLGELVWAAYQQATFSRPSLAAPTAALAVAPAVSDPALEALLRQTTAGRSGSVGVMVRHLRDGRSAGLNADRQFPAASLFKLPVLVEVLKQYRLGRLDLDEELTIEPRHWADGSGVLQAKVGERYPVRELLRLMIVESDNIAALVLLDRVGVEEVNGTIAALGLRDTRIQERVADGAGGLRLAGPHVTSARDLALLLETIAAGRLVDPPTSELALELLERRQAQAWLADGLPWYAKLAHKWGDLPDARHDAGIVYTPEDAYLIVVLTRNAATPRDAAETIAAISRAVFAYFAGS